VVSSTLQSIPSPLPRPTFRLIGSAKIWERGAALPSRLHWFETEVLTQDENLDGLSRINREPLAKAKVMDTRQRVVLHMGSTEIPVYGEQDHSAYNGHFESTCYHSLLLFNSEDQYPLVVRPKPVKPVDSSDDAAPDEVSINPVNHFAVLL